MLFSIFFPTKENFYFEKKPVSNRREFVF